MSYAMAKRGSAGQGRAGESEPGKAGRLAGIYFLLPSFSVASTHACPPALLLPTEAKPRPIIIINSQQNGPNLNVECQTAAVAEEQQQQQQQQ